MPEQQHTSWRKSSRSNDGGQCVEVRLADGGPQVRDSKLGDTSPIFGLSLDDFAAFLGAMNTEAVERKE